MKPPVQTEPVADTDGKGGELGIQNVTTKNYMSRNDIFAEAFNYYVFDGEKILRLEDLQELDSAEGLILTDGKGKGHSMERYRDLLKYAVIRYSADACFLLIDSHQMKEKDFQKMGESLQYVMRFNMCVVHFVQKCISHLMILYIEICFLLHIIKV